MIKKLSTAAFLMAIAAGLASCSGNDKKKQEETQNQDLYSMESAPSSSDILFDEEGDVASTPASEEVAQENQPVEESAVVATNSESSEPVMENVSVQETLDDLSVYRVQDDRETLMMIAFKIYGDYMKWKEIAYLNKEMFDHRYIIKKGMMLKFKVPQAEFKWVPKGEPYLISRGDTLSKISFNVYETPKKWKKIWLNNKPMIRHPDKIFAGFTIYYVPENKVYSPELSQQESSVQEVQEPVSVNEMEKQEVSEMESSESVVDHSAEIDKQMESEVAEKTEEESPLRAKERNPTSL